MDEFIKAFLFIVLILFVSFFFQLIHKHFTKKKVIKIPPQNLKLRFNNFSTTERHVLNEAVIDMLRTYNFKQNKNSTEIEKHKSLQKLKEELKVFIR